jgi:hypothetical protein
MQQATRPTNKKYDLGIGKHPPLSDHHHHEHGQGSAVGEPSFSSLPFHHGYYYHHHDPETALLVEDKKKDHQQHDDDDDGGSVTQFLVEYDATREFPSPLLLLPLVVRETRTTTGSSYDDSSNKTKRLEKQDLPKVQPTRRTWDALMILENNVAKDHHRYYYHDYQDDKTVAARRKNDTFLKNNNKLHSTDDTTNHVSTISATPETVPFIIRATSTEKLDPNTIWVEMMLHSEHMKTLVLAPQAS